MKQILFLLISIIGILNATTPQITVSILPQKYFVEKIVKDKFEVNVMVIGIQGFNVYNVVFLFNNCSGKCG